MSDNDQYENPEENNQEEKMVNIYTEEILLRTKILDYILAGISIIQVITNFVVFKEYSWGWIPLIFTFNLLNHKKGWRIVYFILVVLNIAAWIFDKANVF